MASTYSITFSVTNSGQTITNPNVNGNLGYPDGNRMLPINHQIEDAYVQPGAQQNAMSDNVQVQVKRTDGRIRYYTIDAERSDPARKLIYLLAV